MFAKLRERLKGWKTVAINLLTGFPAAALYIYTEFGTVDFTPLIPAKYVAAFVVAQSALGVLLRIMTTGPVGSKGTGAPTLQTKAGD